MWDRTDTWRTSVRLKTACNTLIRTTVDSDKDEQWHGIKRALNKYGFGPLTFPNCSYLWSISFGFCASQIPPSTFAGGHIEREHHNYHKALNRNIAPTSHKMMTLRIRVFMYIFFRWENILYTSKKAFVFRNIQDISQLVEIFFPCGKFSKAAKGVQATTLKSATTLCWITTSRESKALRHMPLHF